MKMEPKVEEKSNIKNNRSAVLKRIALCVFIVAIMIISLLVIRRAVYSNMQKKLVENLKSKVEVQSLDGKVKTTSITTEIPTETEMPIETSMSLNKNPYASIFEENNDMVAWIVIPDTKIDLPVMQTMEDENYYLNRDFNGEYNNNGTLIMDTDSDAFTPSTNLIIHGHHMKSGEMFGDLELFKEKKYAKENEMITMYFLNCKKEYQIIAVFYSQVFYKTEQVFKFYKFFQADTEEEFNEYYLNCKELSVFDTGVDSKFGDELLTLSTCSYQVENGRFVVVAKKISEEEFALETNNE